MLNGNIYEINLSGISKNINHIKTKYQGYDYYIGVVKSNAYGCGYYKTIETMEKSGINFFATGNIKEALEVRKYSKLGVIILTPILPDDIDTAIDNDISITIDSLEYLKALKRKENLKIHIKLNTGMNRFGTKDIEEIKNIIKYSKENNIEVEGIYTHLYYASNKEIVENQIKIFNNIMENIDYENIKVRHIMNSEGLLFYDKFEYTNAVRIGDLLYGLTYDENYSSVYRLKTNVVKLRELVPGDTVGYDAAYEVKENERIAVLPIGYEAGIVKANRGRNVYINGNKYPIVGNICMCNIFVKVDEKVNLYDEVYLINNSVDVMDIADYLSTAPSEITCIIDKSIKKEYV